MDYKEIIPEYFDKVDERYNGSLKVNEFFNKNSRDDVISISDIVVEQVKSNFIVNYTEPPYSNNNSVFNLPYIIKSEYKPIIDIIDRDNRLRSNFMLSDNVYYNRVRISLSSKIEKLIGIPIKSLLDKIDELKKELCICDKNINFERNHFSKVEKVLREEIRELKYNKDKRLEDVKNLKFIERLKYLFLGSKYFS